MFSYAHIFKAVANVELRRARHWQQWVTINPGGRVGAHMATAVAIAVTVTMGC